LSFFSRDVFFAPSGFAAVLRAPDFAVDGEAFGFGFGFVVSFVRDATGAAASFRAGLAVRVTPILMPESSLEAETDTVGFPVVRFRASPLLIKSEARLHDFDLTRFLPANRYPSRGHASPENALPAIRRIAYSA
jgi:hypothetical protein